MTEPGSVLGERLVQPDRRSCGAGVLVVARMLLDRGYAELVATGRHPVTGFALSGAPADRFRHEVLAMHRRVTGPVDVRGRLQVPWTRALGTPPWAVARQLSATGGGPPRVEHTVVPAWPDRSVVLDRVVAATGHGRPVPMYVGNRWAPRHVVLFLGGTAGRVDALRCYDPARGGVVDVEREAFVGGRLGLGGWDKPWFVVLPSPLPVPTLALQGGARGGATGRRTRASRPRRSAPAARRRAGTRTWSR